MKEQIVMDILREMTAILTQEQLMRLKEVVRVQLVRIRHPQERNRSDANGSELVKLSANVSGWFPTKREVHGNDRAVQFAFKPNALVCCKECARYRGRRPDFVHVQVSCVTQGIEQISEQYAAGI